MNAENVARGQAPKGALGRRRARRRNEGRAEPIVTVVSSERGRPSVSCTAWVWMWPNSVLARRALARSYWGKSGRDSGDAAW